MDEAIIARNDILDATPFNAYHPPPLVPGTFGGAVPKPGASSVVCIAPGEATATKKNWEQELSLRRGDPHVAIDTDDSYPNQMFARDCSIHRAADASDPLAEALSDFWQQRGYSLDDLRSAWMGYFDTFSGAKQPPWLELTRQEVSGGKVFFVAKKDQKAIVLGVVDLRITTSEGRTALRHGSVLLQHPDNPANQWTNHAETFAARYDWQRAPMSGLLIPR